MYQVTLKTACGGRQTFQCEDHPGLKYRVSIAIPSTVDVTVVHRDFKLVKEENEFFPVQYTDLVYEEIP